MFQESGIRIGYVGQPNILAPLILRSREYRFTHMNCSTVDIPFLSEALSGERIWVIWKVANLMWLQQEEKKKKQKKLLWRFA